MKSETKMNIIITFITQAKALYSGTLFQIKEKPTGYVTAGHQGQVESELSLEIIQSKGTARMKNDKSNILLYFMSTQANPISVSHSMSSLTRSKKKFNQTSISHHHLNLPCHIF